MIVCVTIETADQRYATVLNERVVNTSIHKDYSLFHWKAYDVKALKAPVDKFAFLNVAGELQELIEAAQLKTRGVNYKSAKRSSLDLTEEEALQIARAIELVLQRPSDEVRSSTDLPAPEGSAPVEHPEASDEDIVSGANSGEIVQDIDSQQAAFMEITAEAESPASSSDGTTGEPTYDKAPADRTSAASPSKKRKRR